MKLTGRFSGQLDSLDTVPGTNSSRSRRSFLGVALEDILGIETTADRKRGPKSRLERQREAIARLSKPQQRQILDVVEALVAQHSHSR